MQPPWPIYLAGQSDTPFFLRLLVTLLATPSADHWSWTYSCIDGRCVRNETGPSMETNLPAFNNSLDICRMTCGTYGSLWPKPSGPTILSHELVEFHPSRLTFDFQEVAGAESTVRVTPNRDYMNKITDNFMASLKQYCEEEDSCKQKESPINVKFSISLPDLDLQSRTDETYSLDIMTLPGGVVEVRIGSKTVYGARNGLETLRQLINVYKVDSQYHMVIMAQASIIDWPKYAHRGLMLDTAGNFIPVESIKKVLDGMAMNKLNVLHWHATDTASFPLDLPSTAEFAKYGAYSREEVYTKDEIEELVNYGKERGVRVLIEVDMPGRSNFGWQWVKDAKGLNDVTVCSNIQPWREYCPRPPCGQLNPLSPNVYTFVRQIYHDLIRILPPSDEFYLGGDEVKSSCWESSERISHWMMATNNASINASNMANTISGYNANYNASNNATLDKAYLKLWNMFLNNVTSILDQEVRHQGMKYIIWSSNLTSSDEMTGDKSRFIIQVGTSDPETSKDLLSKGFDVIMSPDAWQLSNRAPGEDMPYSWEAVYMERFPANFSEQVLGGETILWTTDVDQYNLEEHLWPRAAAAAERMWADPAVPSEGDGEGYIDLSVVERLEEHRERMLARGIRSEPINNSWCLRFGRNCRD